MADQQANFREEIIRASDFKVEQPLHCPKCSGTSLVLYGQLSFPHTETWENGKLTTHESNFEVGKPFEVLVVECLSCQRRFLLQDEENYQLSLTNAQLAQWLHETAGETSVN